MKKLIPFILTITLLHFSCSEDTVDRDLSGRWNFIEPPHPISRLNRGSDPNPAFDILFTLRGRDFIDVDAVVYGEFIEGESGHFNGNDIVFDGPNFSVTLQNVTRSSNTLQVKSVSYTINGESKSIGALQIDMY